MSSNSPFSPQQKALFERLDGFRQKIRQAAAKSGRDENAVTVVAVTKTVPVDMIMMAVNLGLSNIGENKVQEAAAKRPFLAACSNSLTHHMLGHLQTNKARKAVELFDVIQSLDSERLLMVLDKLGQQRAAAVRCLLEVKLADEPSKTGLPLEEAPAFLEKAAQDAFVKIEGLMTIAPLNWEPDQTRAGFRKLKNLFDRLTPYFGPSPVLSMGMTDDFEMAIEEGATMVRIGRGLFGERE